MSEILSHFKIEALHKLHTIDVPIKDNRLVVVGENGTGKSTLANFIYFFLTRQWSRLLKYDFKAIKAVLNSKEIEITHNYIKKQNDFFEEDSPKLTKLEHAYKEFGRIMNRASSEEVSEVISYVCEKYELSRQIFLKYLMQNARDRHLETELEQNSVFGSTIDIKNQEESPDKIIKGFVKSQILFLPTYRRIEQDLKNIFPGLENNTINVQENLTHRTKSTNYTELVKFGMEDVDRTLQEKMATLKDKVRNGLSELTGAYLHDIIQEAYRTVDFLPELSNLDTLTASAIFDRIPTNVLSDQDKTKLREFIDSIKRTAQIDEKDKVIAHYLTKLVDLYKRQQEDEKDVREFVKVCNDYLSSGKELVYDSSNFKITIQQKNDKTSTHEIKLRMLSSGEKQIISLFSHIYLSGNSSYFIIIDEPELSLSVPWQYKFLPSIIATNRCNGLIATTHSPFIYDNELKPYAESLETFWRPVDELPRQTKK